MRAFFVMWVRGKNNNYNNKEVKHCSVTFSRAQRLKGFNSSNWHATDTQQPQLMPFLCLDNPASIDTEGIPMHPTYFYELAFLIKLLDANEGGVGISPLTKKPFTVRDLRIVHVLHAFTTHEFIETAQHADNAHIFRPENVRKVQQSNFFIQWDPQAPFDVKMFGGTVDAPETCIHKMRIFRIRDSGVFYLQSAG
jgi:hypothetical protein